MVADPVTGVLAFRGQRLAEVRRLKPKRGDEAYVVNPALHGSNVRLNRFSPSNEVLALFEPSARSSSYKLLPRYTLQ